MKKITMFNLLFSASVINGQTLTGDFENLGLAANSYYKDTNSTPFIEANMHFMHQWAKGSFAYWSGGFSYSNVHDSATAGFSNLYGVKPLKGFNASSTFAIGQDKGVISMPVPGTIEGFFITNTTYAYKSMKNGDSFAKKFGGTSGNDPDFLKVIIRGFSGGLMKSDSVRYFLADFRNPDNAQDYIVKTWQYVNTSVLGAVDSIKFFMYSSDVGAFGVNTPLFFGLDQFTVTYPNTVDLTEIAKNEITVFPNPFRSAVKITGMPAGATVTLQDVSGRLIGCEISGDSIDLEGLKNGVYFIRLTSGSGTVIRKIVKD
jgi:hypothetical protein